MIFLPSGDQSGAMPELVTCVSPVPSAPMVEMAGNVQQLLTNAIFVPSGDQTGLSASTLVALTGWTSEPSASIVNKLRPLLVSAMKAILRPSGDQAGALGEEKLAVNPTRCTRPVPLLVHAIDAVDVADARRKASDRDERDLSAVGRPSGVL